MKYKFFDFFTQHVVLPKGSFVCPTSEVSHELKIAQQLVQKAVDQKRARDITLAFGEGTSSLSPQSKGKKIPPRMIFRRSL